MNLEIRFRNWRIRNAMAREIERRRDGKGREGGREGQTERGKRLAPSSGNEISAKTIARQSFTDTATVSRLPKVFLASIVSNWYLHAVQKSPLITCSYRGNIFLFLSLLLSFRFRSSIYTFSYFFFFSILNNLISILDFSKTEFESIELIRKKSWDLWNFRNFL